MLKVGGEVDSFCSKCSLVLAHTIHAMVGPKPVKVECNTCHVVHAYKRPPGAAFATPVKKAPRAARPKGVVISFEEVLRSKNLAMAVKYSPKLTFAEDQVIEHAVFGIGWVSEVKDSTKVEVTFRSEVKVLIHGRA